jgi:hypothetical protein
MSKDQDYHPSPMFNDRRNITVGSTRIVWAERCGHLDAGYVLPGGLRTIDRDRAHAAAVALERVSSEAATV